MTLVLRDVTLRDGLQDEAPVPTQDKVRLFGELVATGITELELTSFVRPDRVPALADAEGLCAATADGGSDGPLRWGVVVNRVGARRALAAGLRELQFVLSVSERHSLENAGRTVERSVGELELILGDARAHGASVEVTLATAFGCPFSGMVPQGDVVRLAGRSLDLGVVGVGLADTIGTAAPNEVEATVRAVASRAGDVPLGIHLHDTRGLAIANALAAIEAGVARVDATVGGLGGCPFAPGATGNLALEDVAHALMAMGVPVELDLDRLIATARLACGLVGRPVASHVGVAGPRFARTPP